MKNPDEPGVFEKSIEEKVIHPGGDFTAQSLVKDDYLYALAAKDPLAFWAGMAESINWSKRWEQVLDGSGAPFYRWFTGGELNASANCLDRHVLGGRKDKAALIFEGENGERVSFTYAELHKEVERLGCALRKLGVKKGDGVTIWMPMIPEGIIAMLACARIGAVHSVVFGGFSAEALKTRILDAGSKVLITADGSFRRGKKMPLKSEADRVLPECPTLEKVVIVERTALPYQRVEGRDVLYRQIMAEAGDPCPPETMKADDPLFILYSSGTTGKPKGILHGTGGYMVGVTTTFRYVFDYREDDVYWCTADIGWITGHSYIVYGPLSCGATVFIYEGAPDYPARDRFWELIEKYKVTVFYTAPTAIRSFMRWGDSLPAGRDLSSLRLLGSVGEPINPEAWLWYHEIIGGGRCPVVDTWWQTETGMIIITSLPGVTPMKPGSATRPFPGVEAGVVDEEGNPAAANQKGYLVLKSPWPAMFNTLYRDDKRYREAYWEQFPGLYFTGDGAWRDEDGYFWIMGRVDDVLNVSGHRIGTMEVESALVDHPAVAEAAVIGKSHAIKGHAIIAFVTLREGFAPGEPLLRELKDHVVKKIGALARPEQIHFASELPKTRSGKIMRRLLRDIAENRALGDTTTLMDSQVVASIREKFSEP
jgi:acetyl-CoA synthetase